MPELSFDSFETDESNKFAVALVRAVVRLEKGYSPLLIHGGKGCGKTHLLSVLGSELAVAHPEISVLSIPDDFPIERFPSGDGAEDAGDGQDTLQYMAYSRKDLLIVDDIERFLDEPKACERFYAIFDTFVDHAKQVVLASSAPIEKLDRFGDRFLSRLRGGIDAPLSPPQPESRLKILKHECERLGLKLEHDILQLLMTEAGKDMGYLKKLPGHLNTFTTLDHQPITKERVEDILSILRSDAVKQKKAATSEQIYAIWVKTQTTRSKAEFSERLEQLEKRLADQLKITDELKDKLDDEKARSKASEDKVSSLTTHLRQLKKELKEKDTLLNSQEIIISKEIAGLEKDVEERDKFATALRGDYEKALAEKDSKIFELEQDCQQASEKLSLSLDEKKSVEKKLKNLVAELEQQSKSREDELLALKIKLEDKEQKLALLREEREMRTAQYEKELSEFNAQNSELQNENLLLKKVSDDLNDRVRELAKQLEQKTAEVAKEAKKCGMAVQQREELGQELRDIKAKLQTEAQTYEGTIKERSQRVEELISRAQAREQELKNLRAETKDREKQLQARIDSLQQQLQQSTAAASKIEEKLASKIEETKKLEKQTSAGATSYEKLKKSSEAERTELQRVIAEKEDALANASQLEAKLKNRIDEVSRVVDDKNAELKSRESSIKELSERLSGMSTELTTTEANLEKTKQSNEVHLQQIDAISTERDKFKKKIDDLVASVETLHGTIKERDEALAKKDAEIGEADAALKQLQQNLVKHEKALAEKEKNEADQLSKFQKELSQLNKEIAKLSSKLDEKESQLRAKDEEISRISDEFSRLREEKTKNEKNLSAVVEKASKNLKVTEQQLAETQKKLKESDALASDLSAKLDESKKSFAKQMEDAKANWTANEKSLSKVNTSLKAELEQAVREIKNLKTGVTELKGEIASREQILVAKEKDESKKLSQLKDELKRRDSELQRLSQGLEKRNKELESNVRTISELSEKLPALEADIVTITEEKKKVEHQLSSTVKEAEKYTKDTENRINALETKLAKAQSHASGIQEQLEAERAAFEERIQEREAAARKREKEFSRTQASTEAKLNEASAKMTELLADIETANQKLREQDERLKHSQEEASKSARLAEEKNQQLIEVRKEMDSLRADFMKRTAEGSETKEQFSSLEAELAKKGEALSAVRRELAELQDIHKKLTDEADKVRNTVNELQLEKKERQEQVDSQQEEIKKLQALLSEDSKGAAESQEELLSRIDNLEKTIAKKEKTIESLTSRQEETAKETVAVKDDEISKLKREHDKLTESLKTQVKEAMRELVKVRETSDKQVEESRKENEALRARIAELEDHLGSAETRDAQTAEPAPFEELSVVAESPEPEPAPEDEAMEEAAVEAHAPACQIEWQHSFEEFDITEINTFFITMAERIARNPGELYNPLCIYGPSFSGKTHILHAIGNLAVSENPDLTCQLISAASLLDKMQTDAATVNEWLETIHLMIVDDFDISDVSPDLQLKLYQFLNGLAERHSQVVIAAHEAPIKMEHLQEYFLRFLESGLLAKLEANPNMVGKYKEAADALAYVAQKSASAPEETAPQEVESVKPKEPEEGEEQVDPLAELLAPNPRLTAADFRGKRAFDEIEEAFRNPDKKWRNKFPLLVIEDDSERRNHFFHALANKLQKIFKKPIAVLSIDKLAEIMASNPSFDLKSLFKRLTQADVVLFNDCENVNRIPETAVKFLKAAIEELPKRNILLMFGTSKKYKKEPVFGTIYKKASRKRI